MYPFFTNTREVWGNPSLTAEIFSETKEISRGQTPREISWEIYRINGSSLFRDTLILPLAILITLPGCISEYHPLSGLESFFSSLQGRECIRKSCPLGQDFLVHSLQRGKEQFHPRFKRVVPPEWWVLLMHGKINVSLLMMREWVVQCTSPRPGDFSLGRQECTTLMIAQ